MHMFFCGLVLIGMVIPFVLMKIDSRWVNWIPAVFFLVGALIMGAKALFYPDEGMADLAERIYFMMFGSVAIGSIIGGTIVHFIKSKK
ncbi:hypothetical protein J7E63_02085 [Bacillus sp. ISL-75]|uniref:hypothetical protein n=1 Tax=Bacillus sp. ISL-75 TaxID=2819137 RepID=UPI001BEA8B48|nr:hypothetical protein [Bacillus sp. ISL-75]MBT2725726.1 hypothetical protein [Bacillus sp. ISL-75]